MGPYFHQRLFLSVISCHERNQSVNEIRHYKFSISCHWLRPSSGDLKYHTEYELKTQSWFSFQLCCYNRITGALFHPGRHSGFVRSLVTPVGQLDDIEAKKVCCSGEDDRLCQLFLSKRPSDTCSQYVPPESGRIHICPINMSCCARTEPRSL